MKSKSVSVSFGLFFISSILVLSACAPAERGPVADGEPTEPGVEVVESATLPPADVPGPIEIGAAEPCALLTEEQVEGAFGASVAAVSPQSESIGTECEYDFETEGTQLRVTFYEGTPAKEYFAVLINAAEESCDAFFEAIFSAGLGDGSGEDLSATPLQDLYRQYIAVLGSCMYVHTEDRPEVGANVNATETIAFNWSSNVAVLGDERVVELTYQENLPAEVQEALSGATDKESTYEVAVPYRDSVLAGYTNILLGLIQEATQ
jgi:hypothetical protein